MPLLGTRGAASASGYGRASQGGLPVGSPDLWFKSEDLASYSEGSSITLWPNRGIYGSNYDLIYNPSYPNTAGVTTPLTKYTFGTAPGAYSPGSSAFLLFRSFNGGGGGGVYFFDGNSSGGTAFQDRTIFYVFTPATTLSTSYGLSAFGTYHGNYSTFGYGHAYGNVGYAYNNAYMILESNDAYSIGASNGIGGAVASAIQQAGHKQGPSQLATTGYGVRGWRDRTPGFVDITYTDNTVAQVNPIGIGTSRSSIPSYGYLHEIIVYGRVLTDGEVTLMRNYLGAKYGGQANA